MLQNYNVSNGTKLPAKITYCKYQSVEDNPSGDPTVRVFIDGFSAGTMSPGESFEIPYAIGELRFETIDPALRAIFRAGIVRVLSTVQTISGNVTIGDGLVSIAESIEYSASLAREYVAQIPGPVNVAIGSTTQQSVAYGVFNPGTTAKKFRSISMVPTAQTTASDVALFGFDTVVTGGGDPKTLYQSTNKLTGAASASGPGEMTPYSVTGVAGAWVGGFTGFSVKAFLRRGQLTNPAGFPVDYESDGSIYIPPNHGILMLMFHNGAAINPVFGAAHFER